MDGSHSRLQRTLMHIHRGLPGGHQCSIDIVRRLSICTAAARRSQRGRPLGAWGQEPWAGCVHDRVRLWATSTSSCSSMECLVLGGHETAHAYECTIRALTGRRSRTRHAAASRADVAWATVVMLHTSLAGPRWPTAPALAAHPRSSHLERTETCPDVLCPLQVGPCDRSSASPPPCSSLWPNILLMLLTLTQLTIHDITDRDSP